MISDPARLREVVDEIAEWSLQQRRQYLADLESGLGKAAADQLKDELRRTWQAKKTK